jgi:hypothetical protein
MTMNFLRLFALAALAGGLASHTAMAQEQWACSQGNAVMNGVYVVTGGGTVTGVGPIASLALIIYNGDGTGTLVFGTTTVNGTSTTSNHVPVTFAVNADCSGSKILGKTHMNFVITPDGNTINWIVTDPGATFSGTAVRLRR